MPAQKEGPYQQPASVSARVLILNAGSSTLKWSVLDADTAGTLDQGGATWEDTPGGRHIAEIRDSLQRVHNLLP
jgi:acetate kinase